MDRVGGTITDHMPRKSPFTIVLSSDEQHELQRRAAKYTLPYFQVLRTRVILLDVEGIVNDEVAARLDTCREFVSQWRQRFSKYRWP